MIYYYTMFLKKKISMELKTYKMNQKDLELFPNRYETIFYEFEKGKYNCETCLFATTATHNINVKYQHDKNKDDAISILTVKCCKSCKTNILSYDEMVYGTNYFDVMQRLIDPQFESINRDDYNYDNDYEQDSEEYEEEYDFDIEQYYNEQETSESE